MFSPVSGHTYRYVSHLRLFVCVGVIKMGDRGMKKGGKCNALCHREVIARTCFPTDGFKLSFLKTRDVDVQNKDECEGVNFL